MRSKTLHQPESEINAQRDRVAVLDEQLAEEEALLAFLQVAQPEPLQPSQT